MRPDDRLFTMTLTHEADLTPYRRTIGGSAGEGTHGGPDLAAPTAMPTREEADVVVSTRTELLNAIRTAGAVVLLDPDVDVIDLTGVSNVTIGANVTLVGHYANPAIPGYGPLLVQSDWMTRTFRTRNSLTLIGVAFLGPMVGADYREAMRRDQTRPTEREIYFDPRDRDDPDEDFYASGIFCYGAQFSAVGCFFAGWSMAGLELGAKNHETRAVIERSTFVDNLMETVGYGIEHYNGEMSVRRCYFDRCRHGISSFGHPTGGYAQAETIYGSGLWAGHASDMHGLAANSQTDSTVAGKYLNSYRCTFMSTKDIAGYGQEGIAIRGVPAEMSYIDKCHFFHPDEPDPENPNVQGMAWRQETARLENFEDRGCVYGPALVEGYGAPLREGAPPDADPPGDGTAERVAALESEVTALEEQVTREVTNLNRRLDNASVTVAFDPPDADVGGDGDGGEASGTDGGTGDGTDTGQ